MLAQVSNNYTALQMQLLTLMQQQQNSTTHHDHNNSTQLVQNIQVDEEKKEENGGMLVPRQFLELSNNQMSNEQSDSSSEERTLSGSSPHPDQEKEIPESEGWAPNKAPRLSPTKPVEQSAMRKARVSVRARSEAPMVIISN